MKIENFNINSDTMNATELQKIDARLKALILTPEGAIPGSRGFGLAREFVSHTPREAENLLFLELEEKVSEFIPEITIASVSCDYDMQGILKAEIYVERRE